MFELIKAERKLSYSNWRYRLLHWTFGVEVKNNILINKGPRLPNFLYTHYCPLFHLTNILLVLSPIILVYKLLIKLMFYCGVICKPILEFIHKLKQNYTIVQRDEEYLKRQEKLFIIKHLKEYQSIWGWDSNPDIILAYFKPYNIKYLSDDEIVNTYIDSCKKILAARTLLEQKQNLRQQRILLWVTISRVVLKAIMIGITTICILAASYIVLFHGIPIMLKVFTWFVLVVTFITTHIIDFLLITGIIGGIFFGVMWLLFQIQEKENTIINKILLPFCNIIVDGICAPFKFTAKTFEICSSFVSQVYEENCPPITIVNETDEVIANISEE